MRRPFPGLQSGSGELNHGAYDESANQEGRTHSCIEKIKRIVNIVLALLAIVCQTAMSHSALQTADSTGSVTVAVAISMVRSADALHFKEIAHFSPDGSKWVAVLRKGNLEHNTNDFTIVLWHTKDIFSGKKPEVLLQMSSSSNHDAIEDVMWLRDNETISFLGGDGRRQVFTFNILKHSLKKITNHPTRVLSYGVSAAGDTVAYIADEPSRSLFDDKSAHNGLVVSSLYDLLVGHGAEELELFVKQGPQAARKIILPAKIARFAQPFVSPDGKKIVLPVYATQVPTTWKEYSDPYIREMSQQKLASGQVSVFAEYMWIDGATGQSGTLLDVPGISIAWRVAWSPDSRSVAIGDTYLPLEGTSGEERKIRQEKTFTVEVEMPAGKINKIADQGLTLVGWDVRTSYLVFEAGGGVWSFGGNNRRFYFRKLYRQWTQITTPMSIQTFPTIFLDEDMNTPPRIVALNPTTEQRVVILELNPQFNYLRFAKVEEFKCKTSDGTDVLGGLYYPVDYIPGRRYPLVIQTHDWSRGRFWIDGPYTTAFVAQPLAGRDIIVVQLPIDEDKASSVQEGPRETSKFEAVIQFLNDKGLIDPSHVGIVGFSRTCFHVEYALTHSRYHFAAASITDGYDGGYFSYVVSLPSLPAYATDEESVNGGPPFGDGIKAWIKNSPSFGIDKVETPLRITALNIPSAVGQWEWFGALSRLGRPVEMVVIKDGTHLLQKPLERMISQQGNVDWFCFWLKGEEDPDPAKAGQYARWRGLRKLQEENDKKAREEKSKQMPAAQQHEEDPTRKIDLFLSAKKALLR